MTAATKTLRDDAARRTAIGVHDRSILVEAGAGSGKTAVMAGRIAAMLAEGIAPKSIAAVTFTELAASELLIRVRDFVADLAAGTVPTELRIAFPDGLSANHSANLANAASIIDEITCSTIHGFCQRLIKPYGTGPLRFAVRSDDHSAEFEIVFSDGDARYPQRSGPKARIKIGSKIQSLSESFADDSPQIDFGDGSLLIYSHLYSLPEGETVEPYPVAKIEAWDWSKANIRVESQGATKRADSVQRTVIEALLADPDSYDVIFDDDGKGEIADVVALRITDSVVSATLFHCKYSGADTPGARLSDLYEVCGQAQKSARWRDRPNRMLQHMLKREQKRRDRGASSRIEHGSAAAIKKLKAGWQDYRFEYDVRIVQPGLSRKAIGEEGLHLLAGVETYLLETRGMRLRVIGSD